MKSFQILVKGFAVLMVVICVSKLDVKEVLNTAKAEGEELPFPTPLGNGSGNEPPLLKIT